MKQLIILVFGLAFTMATAFPFNPTEPTSMTDSSSEPNSESHHQRTAPSLLTNPLDIHMNVDEETTFEVYLSEKPSSPLQVVLRCEGEKGCTTFDGSLLESVELTPEEYRKQVTIKALIQGHDTIVMSVPDNVTINDDNAFVRIGVARSQFWTVLSVIFGWAYFFTWSISFWPQNVTNYRRKSVIGLSPDYTILHFTGFIFYSIFNLTLYFSTTVQEQYEEKFPRSEIPVELNDVVYSVHAALVTGITFVQCFIYERGDQRLALYSKLFQGGVWTGGAILAIVVIAGKSNWLTFIYYFSYIKLTVTAMKYVPQVWFNFQRKSTSGWSNVMVLLDISGGSLSMLQMLTIAHNYDDWKTLLGNLPKFGLAMASCFYDVIFLIQHYVLYGDVPVYVNGKRRSTLKPAGDSHDMLCGTDSSSSLASTVSYGGPVIIIPSSLESKSQIKY